MTEVYQNCENYISMLRNLMSLIQDYLLLTDGDGRPGGAKDSLALVNGDYERREDNRICIWVLEIKEDMYT